MDILIDFDGTCVKHEFPGIGADIGAQVVLRKLVDCGHNLILFTMRSDIDNPSSSDPNIHTKGGTYLTDAVKWFERNNIHLYGIQRNPTQDEWTTSPKAYGQIMIDDSAIGCPLIRVVGERPYVDWKEVWWLLHKAGCFN